MTIDIKNLPHKPGVYIYKDINNKIIYVGKAINLKKRVSQYFQSNHGLGSKTNRLVSQIAKIDYQVVGSEFEALILEANLIKLHQPKYNFQLTDDKNYIYICVSREKIPRLFASYKSRLDTEKYYAYGPFPDRNSVRFILKLLRQMFPYRTYNKVHPRNCLYCHLGLCPGEKPDAHEYKKTIEKIKKILSGKSKKIIDQLHVEMHQYSKNQDYEMALLRKNQIESLCYLNSSWRNLGNLISQIDLPEDKYINALKELRVLVSLPKIDRIEAYDISNSNNFFVGSMVVFHNNNIDNQSYRQFKIKSKQTQDDQSMIKEIVQRRLKHVSWPYPDVLLVDGGKSQVSVVAPLLEGTKVKLLGLAKKEETIILYQNKQFSEIVLPRHSHALRLLQNLRDEAHRFANRYRLKLLKSIYAN